MKQKSLTICISFLAGVIVTLCFLQLDRQVRVPRLESTKIFEVLLPDGTIQHVSYDEIQRQKEELQTLRKQLKELEQKTFHTKKQKNNQRHEGLKDASQHKAKEQASQTSASKATSKNANVFFSKIFSNPIMKKLMNSQVVRQTGELTAVLDLSSEQQEKVEQILKKQQPISQSKKPTPLSESAQKQIDEQMSLEEEIKSILTDEQAQRYQEYTEQKKALAESPAQERDLFELSWRLNLTEEQSPQAREIIEEQMDKIKKISQLGEGEQELTPVEKIKMQLEKRAAINEEAAKKMESILDEDQFNAFHQYQAERETQTKFFQEMIDEEEKAVAEEEPPR